MAPFAKLFDLYRTRKGNVDRAPIGTPDTEIDPGASKEKDVGITSGAQVNTEAGLEADRKIKALESNYQWDPNLPSDTLQDLDEANNTHDTQQELDLVHVFEDNSPYPEVRAAVRNVGTTGSLNQCIVAD